MNIRTSLASSDWVTNPMQSHEVTGGGGITLRVDETGTERGRPILFIHGLGGSRQSWYAQMHSDLSDDFRLVALDGRGHGRSDKPKDAYEPELWADDIKAVIDALALEEPVLVGSSGGGIFICFYLSEYGEDGIAGLNLVSAITKFTEAAMELFGDDFIELAPAFSSDDAEEYIGALDEFIRLLPYGELPPREHYFLLGHMALVPPYVRSAMTAGTVTHDDLLPQIESPVLITHGEEDSIVLTAAAEEHAEAFPNARTSFYPNVGHLVPTENTDRFNRELREFVNSL